MSVLSSRNYVNSVVSVRNLSRDLGQQQRKFERAILMGPMSRSGITEWKKVVREVRPVENDLLIGVDSGTANWRLHGHFPDFAIGDWDSLKNKEILKKVSHITLPEDKDRSDTCHAVALAMIWGAKEIICIGFSGGRPDHHLAVLKDLADLSVRPFCKLRSLSVRSPEADYFFLSPKISSWNGRLKRGAFLSLFSMGGSVYGVTLKGFRYGMKNKVLTPSSHGLSNAATSDSQEVRIKRGRLLLIHPHLC